jgi:hypothetical protein
MVNLLRPWVVNLTGLSTIFAIQGKQSKHEIVRFGINHQPRMILDSIWRIPCLTTGRHLTHKKQIITDEHFKN